MVKRMVIQNQQRVKKQRFRFDTIDYALVLKFDIAMLAIQFLVSIIYIGSWITFILVRLFRVLWGLAMKKWRLGLLHSPRAAKWIKADYIGRLVTVVIYFGVSFGFSVMLPRQFCDLMGTDEDEFSSCKWQVFGFRMVFMLMFIPIELILLAVVYRYATDTLFKTELRAITGISDFDR